ncbi:outer membrane protein assembly factor BamE [Burkholderia pseudomallei]|uniref:outer membrane protein assembly factor BamE n=1 Tax=Burkholderia pseudomallei TaxID=28450 RepID=UPI00351C8E57
MRSTVIAAVAVVGLAACSSYDSVTQRIAQSITPYRITVVQGNFVSQEKASQLQVGMSREQVRALLGTPLLTDMFHADRWDYLFYFKRGSTSVVQQRDLVVNFAGDRLAGWSGAENLPSELDLLADIDGDRRGKKARAAAAAAPAVPRAAASISAAAARASATRSAPAACTTNPSGSAATNSASPTPSARAIVAHVAGLNAGRALSSANTAPASTAAS